MMTKQDCWNSSTHKLISEYSSNMLWRYIRDNATEHEAESVLHNYSGLTHGDLKTLAEVRLMLSPDVKKFINETAPAILNRLLKESQSEVIVERNKIRGRIDWTRTHTVRMSAGNDKSLYVCHKKSSIYDLPENRLFLCIVQHLNQLGKTYGSRNYEQLTWYSELDEYPKWVDLIALITYKTTQMLKNPFLSKITPLNSMTERLIVNIKKHRSPFYRQMAETADTFYFAANEPFHFLKRELGNNILEPLNKDTLYEIAVLFKTIHTAQECGWQEIQPSLIGGSSQTASVLKKNNTLLKIYTQKLPPEFKLSSIYGELMKKYGLGERYRRPDIILELDYNGVKEFLIIEIKRSEGRTYLADGAYKLLGYLKDFASASSVVNGFLVAWKGLNELCFFENEVNMLMWDNYENGLKEFLTLKNP